MTTPDEDWIDALAGRPPESGADADVREARALRAQILAQRPASEALVVAADAARESELLARARRNGLLPAAGARPGGTTGVAARRWRLAGGVAAAAGVVLALALTLTWRPATPPETLRGVGGGVVHLEAPDPQLLKRQLIVELTAAGLKLSGYEKLGSVGIDADLPEPVPPAVRTVLEQHHIPVPGDGVLVIEITAADKR